MHHADFLTGLALLALCAIDREGISLAHELKAVLQRHWLLYFALHLSHRLVFLPVAALRVIVFFKEIDVPLTSYVSVTEE